MADDLSGLWGEDGAFADNEVTRLSLQQLGMRKDAIEELVSKIGDLSYIELTGTAGSAEFWRNPDDGRWDAYWSALKP